ncbi:VWA domain-containing protein [Acidobacteria bacterium AB60]|nr:VWA domain-containing protein [Acidobacteria bacterium AB60]
MKRELGFALLGLVLVPCAHGSRKVTVAQLEQAAAGLHTKADADAAFSMGDLELTERLSPARMERIQALLPGEKSRHVLVAIADASEFEAPPAEEIPGTAPPSVPEQRRILGMVVTYATRTIPQLPNFIATRTTDRFEDTPMRTREHAAAIPYQPIHFVARAEATVTYRDKSEVYESVSMGKKPAAERGLTSRGEFGAMLATVLLDAAQNKLEWRRWEQGASGPVAVFGYAVPKERSHYAVDFCCVQDSEGRSHPFHNVAGYEGEMRVDAGTGTILHLDLTADLKPADPIHAARTAVDYGRVEIGGRTYFCPLHSVAFSRAQGIAGVVQEMAPVVATGQNGGGYVMAPVAVGTAPTRAEQVLLNDITFRQYHVFRAESRVVSAENQKEKAPLATEPAPQTTAGVSAAATEPQVAAAPMAEDAAAPPAPAAALPVSPEPVVPEITTADVADVPNTSAPMQPPVAGTGFRLRTTTRLVDVGVVAFDKKGRPVTDLRQSDFEIDDNGRRQEIKYFGQAGTTAAAAVPSPAVQAGSSGADGVVFTNSPAAPALQERAPHTTIFLIDSSHVAFPDLSYARSEMLRFLKGVPADEPVGLYVLRKYGFEILREPTMDHAQLALTLSRWLPSAQDLLQSQNEEMRNRQSMEYVQTKYDMLAVNGNVPTGAGDMSSAPPDVQRRSLGERPEQDALGFLIGVARHVAALKGHKSLIWVASDNVLADFSEKAPQGEKGDKHLEHLAVHATEALNEAQVSIYPLDCSQLEANVVGANLQHANVQVKETTPDLPVGDISQDEALQERRRAQRDINPGRLKAQMQQDAHPIQAVFRELATATGGRPLRRAGDIAAELESIVNDGRAAYLLSFTPDVPADDKYHHIAVKVTGRGDVTLRYRTGYVYAKEPATVRERFQQAVWQPRDVTEVGLRVTRDGAGDTGTLKVTIAATDLEMAQAGERWTDKVDIFLVERDDAASHARLHGRTLQMTLRPETYQRVLREGIALDEPLPAKTTPGSFRIVVVDENSGRMGSVTLPVGR